MAFRYRRTVRKRQRTAAAGVHSYFETLRARPERLLSASLRVQSGGSSDAIDTYTASPPNQDIVYDATEDAARIGWPSDFKDVRQGLFVPINIDNGSLLFVWDAKYSSLWRMAADGGNVVTDFAHKEWNIRAHSQKIFLETRFRPLLGIASGYAGRNSFRTYDPSSGTQVDDVAGRTTADPAAPSGPGSDGVTNQELIANTWLRYIQEVKLNVPSSHATAFNAWEAEYGVAMSTGRNYHIWSAWILTPTDTYKRLRFLPVDDESPRGVLRDTIHEWFSEHDTSSDMPHSTGGFRFTGVDGTAIPSTTKLTRDSDGHAYNLTSSGTISGGVAVVNGRATGPNSGLVGNCSSGVAFTVTSPVAGLNSAAASERSFVGGQNLLSTTTYIWERNLVVLHNYTLPEVPEEDGVIFSAEGLG